MDNQVIILGCGSASPTKEGLHASSQVIIIENDIMMIDCGEGTQYQLARACIGPQRISKIFITHLHGDHWLGLLGLLAWMDLQGRDSVLNIYGPQGLEYLVMPTLRFLCSDEGPGFRIIFHKVPSEGGVIYNIGGTKVTAIPLHHTVPCTGYLFERTIPKIKLDPEKIDACGVPKELLGKIKQGETWMNEDREITVKDLMKVEFWMKSYAYVSDTKYDPSISPWLKGKVDVLYSEASFIEETKDKAELYGHMTVNGVLRLKEETEAKELYVGHISARYSGVGIDLVKAELKGEGKIVKELQIIRL
jgi:ribonuclease Z